MYASCGKRLLDLVLSSLSLLVLSPIWIPIAILVRIKMGSPLIFRQKRAGLGGRPFTIFKFRSVDQSCGSDGELLPEDQRLNRFGRILRTSSLDELPELLNVIQGDMSMVGPRPFLPEYVPLFTARQSRRNEVRPGITGWAQINGRHQIPFSKRIELDIWYLEHMSFYLDLKILLATIPSALASRGVNATEREEDVVDLGRKDDL